MHSRTFAEDDQRPHDREVSISEIGGRIWRRRGWVVVGVALAVLIALVWLLLRASSAEAPVVYYVELRGISGGDPASGDRQYPNGATFSPEDLLLPEVLAELDASLQLQMPMDRLRRAIGVTFGSPFGAAVIEKYRRQLERRNLDAAALDLLNESFEEELRATTRRGLRIEIDRRNLGVSGSVGEQMAIALPETWSRVFTERFRVFVPASLPSVSTDGVVGDTLDESSEILSAERVLGQIRAGLELIEKDNRLLHLTTSTGNTGSDLLHMLAEYESLYFFPVYRHLFDRGEAVIRSYTTELELEIQELDLQIDNLNATLSDLQRFRTDSGPAEDQAAGEYPVVQLDESLLDQLMGLASAADLAGYLRQTLDQRRELVAERAKLVTRLDRIGLDRVAGSLAEPERMRERARAGLSRLAAEYRDLSNSARGKLRLEQGRLYEPLGQPEIGAALLPGQALLTLSAAASLGLLFALTAILLAPPR